MKLSRESTVRWLVASAPAGLLVVDAATDRLGVNPVEALQNRLGFWALGWLLMTLALTPLARLTGWSWPHRSRRFFGLASFAYALVHVTAWAVLDHDLDLGEMWDDVVKRRFLAVGFGAFVLMLPLALTSTDGWLRRLGKRRWSRLHLLVFAVLPLAVVHHLWRYKVIELEPVLLGALGAGLVLVRIVRRWRRRAGSPSTA